MTTIKARVARALVLALGLAACRGESVTSPPTLASPTCGNSGLITLSANQSMTLDCTSAPYINLAAGARYLIVPQLASGGDNAGIPYVPVAYQIGVPAASGDLIANGPTLTTGLIPSATGTAMPPRSEGQQPRLDHRLRAHDRQLLAGNALRLLRGQLPAGVRASVVPSAPPAVGSIRTFQMPADTSFKTYVATGGRLMYVGANILLYVDTLAPVGGFTTDQLTTVGQYFDQTLYSIDVSAFGQPSDIDNNGRVIMLMSPSVNALTPRSQCSSQGYVAGYFDGTDFFNLRGSNQGEIFYTIVPDPNGTQSCAHTLADLEYGVPPTFLHELQHLISFSQHVVIHNGREEEGWLDEGMSIVAEELGAKYYETKFPPPTGRTNPAQLFPDSAQGFVSGFLEDSYAYLLRPDTASITLHSDADDGLEWRGGDWLLLHWLGDQKGTPIYTALEQSNLTGIANIAASAGASFPSVFGNFSLSLWTDSIVGESRSAVPSQDRFATRNLRQIYQRLFDTSGGSPYYPRPYPVLPAVLPSSGLLTGRIVPGSMAYYILDTTGRSGVVTLEFAPTTGTSFLSTLNAQVSVYRLP